MVVQINYQKPLSHTRTYTNIGHWEWAYNAHTHIKRTGDRAEQPQRGRIARVLVDHALAVRLRGGHAQRDGFVEFAPARLHGDDGRNGDAAAQQLGRQIRVDRLRLRVGGGCGGSGGAEEGNVSCGVGTNRIGESESYWRGSCGWGVSMHFVYGAEALLHKTNSAIST